MQKGLTKYDHTLSTVFYEDLTRLDDVFHARAAGKEAQQLILRLLESELKVSSSSQAMIASKGYPDYSQKCLGKWQAYTLQHTLD